MMTRHAVICLALFTLVTMGNALPKAETDHVEYKVKKLMECTKIKAVGLAVIGKGDVTSMAFGSEAVDDQRARIQGEVNNHTKFCLGGATEAFTAVMLAKLMARNENITWSTPIKEITGQPVHLSESYRSAHLTLKDIFAQRSGYPDMDIVTVAKPFKDAEELTRHLRYLKPVAGFRDKFIPNKILFSVLNQAIRDLTNASWENMMKEFIFRPLQMDSVVFLGENGVPGDEDIAKPMVYHGKHAHYIPLGSFRGLQLIKEAASVCMSPVDMGKWLKFLTTGRDAKGRKLIDMDVLKETFEGVQARGHSDDPAIAGFKRSNMFKVAYNRDQNALGWIAGNYRGYRFVSQDGSMAGADTLATYVPDKKIGVFVSITGAEEGTALAAKTLINTYVLDHLMRGGQLIEPWMENMDACSVLRHIQSHATPSTKHNNIRRTNNPAGGRSLYDYTGPYRNYAYGDVHIRYNETLTMEYGQAEYRLDGTNHNDTFELSAKQDLWFTTGAGKPRSKRIIAVFVEQDDRIRDVVISGLDKNGDILFSRDPVRPRLETFHEGCRCEDGASTMTSSVSLFVLTLLVSLVHFFR